MLLKTPRGEFKSAFGHLPLEIRSAFETLLVMERPDFFWLPRPGETQIDIIGDRVGVVKGTDAPAIIGHGGPRFREPTHSVEFKTGVSVGTFKIMRHFALVSCDTPSLQSGFFGAWGNLNDTGAAWGAGNEDAGTPGVNAVLLRCLIQWEFGITDSPTFLLSGFNVAQFCYTTGGNLITAHPAGDYKALNGGTWISADDTLILNAWQPTATIHAYWIHYSDSAISPRATTADRWYTPGFNLFPSVSQKQARDLFTPPVRRIFLPSAGAPIDVSFAMRRRALAQQHLLVR